MNVYPYVVNKIGISLNINYTYGVAGVGETDVDRQDAQQEGRRDLRLRVHILLGQGEAATPEQAQAHRKDRSRDGGDRTDRETGKEVGLRG